MKKLILTLCVAAMIVSCGESLPENVETTYVVNNKAFIKKTGSTAGVKLVSVIDNWTGTKDYEPNSGEKLIKLDIAVTLKKKDASVGDEKIDLIDADFELYDSKSKKAYVVSTSSSEDENGSFDGVDEAYKSGYLVYSVAKETNLEDLYLVLEESDDLKFKAKDHSAKDVNTLLPLKLLPYEAKEKVMMLNKEVVVNDVFDKPNSKWNIKSITTNALKDPVVAAKIADTLLVPNTNSYAIIDFELTGMGKEGADYIRTPILDSDFSNYVSSANAILNNAFAIPTGIKAGETVKGKLYYEYEKGLNLNFITVETGSSGEKVKINL